MTHYVQYAISLGISQRDDLWKVQFIHPLDAMAKESAWLTTTSDDPRIGTVIDGIEVAKPGPRMVELVGWLYERLSKYPYYWPYEGVSVDKYGYDFEVTMNVLEKNRVSDFEVTQIAYDIIKSNLKIEPALPDPSIVEDETYILEAGGAYLKYVVTLDKAKPVSEIAITPFTEYDLEVVSVMYEEDIETFHPRKEIIPQAVVTVDKTINGETERKLYSKPIKQESSTRTMLFKFSAVLVRRFTFILRQKNYKKNTYLIRGQEVNKKELWDKISAREATVTMDLNDGGLQTVEQSLIDSKDWTGWDIYLQQTEKHRKDLLSWKKEMADYRIKLEHISSKKKEKALEEKRYRNSLDSYRSEYKIALQKYNKKVAQHKKEIETYNSDKKKYERDLALYNKYLRDLKTWNSKWG